MRPPTLDPRTAADREATRPAQAPGRRDVLISRWLLVLIPVVLIALVVGTRLAVTSRKAKVWAASSLAGAIAERSGSAVRLRGIRFGWAYQPCVQELQIYRRSASLQLSAAASEACVERWASALGSGFRAVQIHLDRPSIELQGFEQADPATPMVDVRPSSSTVAGSRSEPPRHEPLREINLRFDDLRLAWKSLPLPQRIAGGSLGPIDGALTLQRRGVTSAVSLSLREPRTGLSINGRATPTDDGWDVSAQLEGDLAPSFGSLLARFGLDVQRLPVKGELGAVYSPAKRTLSVDLDLFERDLDIANALVSSRRLAGFEARQKLRIAIDFDASRFSIEDAVLEVNGVPLQVSLEVRGAGDSPELDATLRLPTTPLTKLLRSIPGAEPIEALGGMSPAVLFVATFRISGLLRDPETWKVDLDPRVVGMGSSGEGSGLEYLQGDELEHRPLTREGRAQTPRIVGPGTPGWLRYGAIPPRVRSAIQISEDASFFVHHGVDLEEVRAAIVESVTRGERARGGSTLTQQLIKNLYLSRERTAARKVQELLLSLLMESALSKEKIFELYANLIEWGPGVYGINQAALHYFGRSPQQLSLKEAAYLATIIPGPMLYHSHYEQGVVPAKFDARVNRLLEKMAKVGRITEADRLASAAEVLRFARHAKAPAATPTAAGTP